MSAEMRAIVNLSLSQSRNDRGEVSYTGEFEVTLPNHGQWIPEITVEIFNPDDDNPYVVVRREGSEALRFRSKDAESHGVDYTHEEVALCKTFLPLIVLGVSMFDTRDSFPAWAGIHTFLNSLGGPGPQCDVSAVNVTREYVWVDENSFMDFRAAVRAIHV